MHRYGAFEALVGLRGTVRKQANLHYREDAQAEWQSEELDISSMLATNVPMPVNH